MTMADRQERAAMLRALDLARSPGVPSHPNPRVGCVLLGPSGEIVGAGYHRGAGTAHAEVVAIAAAGARACGATAVVTLEPCDHTGRTPPCTRALLQAGVRRVVVAQRDPHPRAAGGLERLAAAGVVVEAGLLVEEATALNSRWTFAHTRRRPFVTWKLATTLDGRSAAADGSSRWVTSRAARDDVHRLRAHCDTILVGTGTVQIDDPHLTVRHGFAAAGLPPLRAVMGTRPLAAERRVHDGAAATVRLRTRSPHEALEALYREHDRHHVLLEGGPTLAASFLRAGLVDEVVAYVAPALLGAGRAAVGDLGIGSIGDALRLRPTDVTVIGSGDDTTIRITSAPIEKER
jgi:diaminohydroxyphosphoribosylaminopyrimidine deaminase/5-amino-6-(5-phosphoribosylamino)uracil reductase